MQIEKTGIIALTVLIAIILSVGGVWLYYKYVYTPVKIVDNGDCVDVDYIGRFTSNGTVFDTSYENIAKEYGIYNGNRTYQPLKIFVDTTGDKKLPGGYENYSSGMIKGFVKALVGMKEGETKNVTIPPKDAYGVWNESITPPLNRIYPDNITQTMNKSSFGIVFKNVSVSKNSTFDYGMATREVPNIINATIVNVTDTNVTFVLFPKNGSSYVNSITGWNETIVFVNDTVFKTKIDVPLNLTFTINFWGRPIHYKVVEVNNTSILFAINMQAPKIEFVNQSLTFTIHVDKIYKTSHQSS